MGVENVMTLLSYFTRSFEKKKKKIIRKCDNFLVRNVITRALSRYPCSNHRQRPFLNCRELTLEGARSSSLTGWCVFDWRVEVFQKKFKPVIHLSTSRDEGKEKMIAITQRILKMKPSLNFYDNRSIYQEMNDVIFYCKGHGNSLTWTELLKTE